MVASCAAARITYLRDFRPLSRDHYRRYALGFFERGGYYEEKISIDRERRIIEYDVPAHANVLAGKYVKDLKSRITVLKLGKLKKCYVMKNSGIESELENEERSLKWLTFPDRLTGLSYRMKDNHVLPIAMINPISLPKFVQESCKGFSVVKARVSNENNMENGALQMARRSRNDQSKRKLVKEFIVCNQSNSEVIDKCDEKLLEVTCTKVFARTCVYKAICTRKDKKCNGTHENNSLHCCTFYCNSPVKIQSKMNPLTLFLPGRYSLGTPLYIIIYHFLNLFSCVLKFFDF